MITWSDPLVMGALIVALLIVARGGYSLWRELKSRSVRRLLNQREIRILIADYRARYGAREASRHLEKDLEVSRSRLEEFAAKWKFCQKKAEEAMGHQEQRALDEEERKAHQAFLKEANRLRQLKKAQEQLR